MGLLYAYPPSIIPPTSGASPTHPAETALTGPSLEVWFVIVLVLLAMAAIWGLIYMFDRKPRR